MNSYTATKKVSFSAEQMFELVSDVKKYSEFLPWISKASIFPISPDSFVADLSVMYDSIKKISYQYQSTVKLYKPSSTDQSFHIKAISNSHIFKHMQSHWQFINMEHGCCIKFTILFQIKNSFLQNKIINSLHKIAAQTIQLFEQRAKVIFELTI